MDSSGISKKEYLKKYLSGGEKKKKKKKSTQSLIIKSKIVDDDIDLKNMKPVDDDDLEIFDIAEEAPQIVGIIDDRPEEIRIMSEFRSTKKWKIVTDEYGIEDVKITAIDRRKSDEGSPKREKEISIEIRKNSSKKALDLDEKNKPDTDLSVIKRIIKQEIDSDSASSKNSKKVNHDPDALDLTRPIKKEKDASPPAKSGKESNDSDASPPRKYKKENYDSDASPPRRSIKKEKDSDSSPPRKSHHKEHSRTSPSRRKNRKDDSDSSPPRRKQRNDDSDASPPRRRQRKDSDSSPPRRRRRKSDSDSSPPRRRRRKSDSDSSPPRKSSSYKKKSSEHDSRYHKRDENRSKSDSSKSKRKIRSPSVEESSKRNGEYGLKVKENKPESKKDTKSSQLEKTLSGKKAGLQSAEDMIKESEKLKQKEKELFDKMSDEVTGKHAAAIVRNRKTGRRHDPKEEARKKREKEEKEAEKIAQYAVWGKGVKQVQDRQDKIKEDLYEMSKPLARYKDDKDLEEMLKNQEREGDPMLEYIRSKKKTESGGGGGGGPSKPQYEGAYMPNRYNIKPGHKWDGVDRSNGYEKKWFEEQNAKKAREEEAFKWSTIDM